MCDPILTTSLDIPPIKGIFGSNGEILILSGKVEIVELKKVSCKTP